MGFKANAGGVSLYYFNPSCKTQPKIITATTEFSAYIPSEVATPFPEDVPTAPLVTQSLKKLITGDDAEHVLKPIKYYES